MKRKILPLAALLLFAVPVRVANAVVIARGACVNHYAIYYNLTLHGIDKYISGCTE